MGISVPQSEQRPPSVTFAVCAMSVALLIGVSILYFGWVFPGIALGTLVIIGALIVGVARRSNWARWTLTLITVGTVLMTLPIVRFQLGYSLLVGVATGAQLLLEGAGCVLLFRPAAARWYGRRAA
jgi:hypothetical protein